MKIMSNPSRIHSLLIALSISSILTACGSSETIDSSDVPLKKNGASDSTEQNPNSANPDKISDSKPIQDIYQSYGLTFDEKTARTMDHAQFRVRDAFGTTIRMTKASQTQFQSMDMRKIDGDTVNLVADLLNRLTIIPFFSLLKTGTFYSASQPNTYYGVFRFVDDYNNVETTQISIPDAKLEAIPSSFNFASNSANLMIKVSTAQTYPGAQLSCYLSSKHKSEARTEGADSQANEKTEISSKQGTLNNKTGTCQFFSSDLKMHQASLEPIEVKVELTLSDRKNDSLGRPKELRASRVMSAQISAI